MTATTEELLNLSVGDSGPRWVFENVDRSDFVKYAGASGDFNPLHWNDQYARESGHPSVFGQGMLTAGFISSYVVEWFGIEHVRRFKARFESRLWPGDTVTVTGEIVSRSVSEEHVSYEVEIHATNESGVLISTETTIRIPTN